MCCGCVSVSVSSICDGLLGREVVVSSAWAQVYPVTSMAPNPINLHGLVTSMAPNPVNLLGLVTSMAPGHTREPSIHVPRIYPIIVYTR